MIKILKCFAVVCGPSRHLARQYSEAILGALRCCRLLWRSSEVNQEVRIYPDGCKQQEDRTGSSSNRDCEAKEDAILHLCNGRKQDLSTRSKKNPENNSEHSSSTIRKGNSERSTPIYQRNTEENRIEDSSMDSNPAINKKGTENDNCSEHLSTSETHRSLSTTLEESLTENGRDRERREEKRAVQEITGNKERETKRSQLIRQNIEGRNTAIRKEIMSL
jgi:hypothetical protein